MSWTAVYRGWIALIVFGALSVAAQAGEPTTGRGESGDAYRDRRSAWYPYNSYPAAEVQAVPPARAAAAAARWRYHTTYQDMGQTIRFAKEDFENSPELQNALAAEAEAYAAFESVRRRVLAPLASDMQYQTFLMLAADIERDMETLRARPNPPMNELVAMAAVKLNHTTRARDKEVLLLEGSDEYKSARQRLVEAAARVSKMRGQFDRSLRRNPEVAALRDQLQEDRIAKIAAETYADAAEEARDLALNFAHYVNRDTVYLHSYNYRYYPPFIRY